MASIQGDDSKAENSFSIFVSATVEYEMKRSRPILINEYVINDKFYQVKKTNVEFCIIVRFFFESNPFGLSSL